MDLFDRYLQAVGSFLPKSIREDVVRELSVELRSQAEEREAEYGRPLNQPEQEQLLRQWGHPWLLAARYQPRRHLIGSSVFPFYWLVLKISVGIALLVHVIAAAVLLANDKPPSEVIARLATLPFGPLLVVFAWVTIVFVVLDRAVPRMPFVTNWNPTALPDVREQGGAPSMACRVGEVVMGTIFVLWLAVVPHQQWLIFGPAAAWIQLAPVWFEIHFTLLALALVGLVVSWINLLYPQRHTFRRAAKLAGHVVSIVVFWFLANLGVLIVPTQSGEGEVAAAMASKGLRLAYVVVVIVSAVELVREALRLVKRLRAPHYSSF